MTVKLISEYALKNGELEPQRIVRTRIREVESVNTHQEDTLTTIILDEDDVAFAVPHFYGLDDWKRNEVTTAVYVENEKGKTIHSLRSMLNHPVTQ